ncbi:MAG: class I SAM-dependent methyltransferase, partial [Sciscionella sp.]
MAGEEQYFAAAPQVSSRPSTVHVAAAGVAFDLAADAGVFSARGLDPGTAVLLAEAPYPEQPSTVLDLGCGYGPITFTLAKRCAECRVFAVDVNTRALRLVRANAAELGTAGVRACLPEEVPPQLRFAAIYSNPPIRIGKPALHELFRTWLPRLE